MSEPLLIAYDDGLHATRVRAIYEASFPDRVRAPWDSIARHRDDEELLILTDGSPVGFALIRHLGDTSFTFVRYFAIDAAQRSSGYGARLLDMLARRLNEQERTALLLDVEDPRAHPESGDDDRRRIAFYERHGLSLLPVPDYAPPEHGTTGEIVPLLIMGMPLGHGAPIEGAHLEACVAAVYLHRYGVTGPGI